MTYVMTQRWSLLAMLAIVLVATFANSGECEEGYWKCRARIRAWYLLFNSA